MTKEKPNYTVIRGSQKTKAWFKEREGLITGSVSKQVKGTGKAWIYETLAMMTSKWTPKDLDNVEDVARGNRLEPENLAEYSKATGNKIDTEVSFIHKGRTGFSPDAVMFKGKTDVITRLVEAKAPQTKNHIRYIIENKIPKEHVDQIIHGFVVVDTVDEIDFASYDPEFKLKPLHIITAKRSDYLLEIQVAEIAYEKFISELDRAYDKLIK